MDSPKFTWFIQNEEDNFIASNSYTAEGSYVPGDYLIKNIQIWNNYSGNEDIEDAKSINLIFSFKNYEDNFLLNLIEVSVENQNYKKIYIDIDRGYINIGNLTGNSNTGQSNSSNYKNIRIKIGPVPENIKTDLKTLIFYLELNSNAEKKIQTQIENNISNILFNADKTFVIESDKIMLASANDYTDQQIEQTINKITGDSIEKIKTLKELAEAINNNVNFGKESIATTNSLKQKISNLEYLTNGFNGSIRKYVDKTTGISTEAITTEEMKVLLDYIKKTLDLQS